MKRDVDTLPPDMEGLVQSIAHQRLVPFIRALRAPKFAGLWRHDVRRVLAAICTLFSLDGEETVVEALDVGAARAEPVPPPLHDPWELHAERFMQRNIETRLRDLLAEDLDPDTNAEWESMTEITLRILVMLGCIPETIDRLLAVTDKAWDGTAVRPEYQKECLYH